MIFLPLIVTSATAFNKSFKRIQLKVDDKRAAQFILRGVKPFFLVIIEKLEVAISEPVKSGFNCPAS
jgi:hypothetical protein